MEKKKGKPKGKIDEIREQCQKLILKTLENANKELEEAEKDKNKTVDHVKIMGIFDKAVKYIAVDNKLEEGDFGSGFKEDLDE